MSNPYVLAFLVIALISAVVYLALALRNWRLVRLARKFKFGSEAQNVAMLIGLLCLTVFLNDVFWIIVIVFPRSFVLYDRVLVLFLINLAMRLGTALALFRLWQHLYGEAEDNNSSEGEVK